MKKKISILCFSLIVVSSLLFTACGTKNDSSSAKDKSSKNVFTIEELKKYDGQNGNPAYIAVDGTVYDVSNVKPWKGGMHNGNSAGMDLSKVINASPHGKDVLNKIPKVGTLK